VIEDRRSDQEPEPASLRELRLGKPISIPIVAKRAKAVALQLKAEADNGRDEQLLERDGLLKSCVPSGHAVESPIGDQPNGECEQRA
jgi:hypothetical protein